MPDNSIHNTISQLIAQCHGFDWDEGNIGKNWLKHRVTDKESEEIFKNVPLMLSRDIRHSEEESRYIALGKTGRNRLLSVLFTIRGKKIRNISARAMSRKDRKDYEKAEA